ncbi:unnamed protein product [Lampetra fluviatilis]
MTGRADRRTEFVRPSTSNAAGLVEFAERAARVAGPSSDFGVFASACPWAPPAPAAHFESPKRDPNYRQAPLGRRASRPAGLSAISICALEGGGVPGWRSRKRISSATSRGHGSILTSPRTMLVPTRRAAREKPALPLRFPHLSHNACRLSRPIFEYSKKLRGEPACRRGIKVAVAENAPRRVVFCERRRRWRRRRDDAPPRARARGGKIGKSLNPGKSREDECNKTLETRRSSARARHSNAAVEVNVKSDGQP